MKKLIEGLDAYSSLDYLYGLLAESKDRLIDRLPNLNPEQKEEMKTFLRKRNALESRFDWNKPDSITYDSFRSVADEYPEWTNPDDIEEFYDRQDHGNGVVTYEVYDGPEYEGMHAVRKVVDEQWGKDCNPWCLISRHKEMNGVGEMDDAMDYWDRYSAKPRRIAFRNGRLIGFMARSREEYTFGDIDEAILNHFPELWDDYRHCKDTTEWLRSHPEVWEEIHDEDEDNEFAVKGNYLKDWWWDRDNCKHKSLEELVRADSRRHS